MKREVEDDERIGMDLNYPTGTQMILMRGLLVVCGVADWMGRVWRFVIGRRE